MAGLYSSLKTYDKAISQYEWVISHHPNHQEATLYLAAVYSETKQPEKAIKLFEILLENVCMHAIKLFYAEIFLRAS
jgi:tetratricopeptide (TPR) repeat protein